MFNHEIYQAADAQLEKLLTQFERKLAYLKLYNERKFDRFWKKHCDNLPNNTLASPEHYWKHEQEVRAKQIALDKEFEELARPIQEILRQQEEFLTTDHKLSSIEDARVVAQNFTWFRKDKVLRFKPEVIFEEHDEGHFSAKDIGMLQRLAVYRALIIPPLSSIAMTGPAYDSYDLIEKHPLSHLNDHFVHDLRAYQRDFIYRYLLIGEKLPNEVLSDLKELIWKYGVIRETPIYKYTMYLDFLLTNATHLPAIFSVL